MPCAVYGELLPRESTVSKPSTRVSKELPERRCRFAVHSAADTEDRDQTFRAENTTRAGQSIKQAVFGSKTVFGVPHFFRVLEVFKASFVDDESKLLRQVRKERLCETGHSDFRVVALLIDSAGEGVQCKVSMAERHACIEVGGESWRGFVKASVSACI